MNRLQQSFNKLSLQGKLILIGAIPTFFFLYVSRQYYQGEKDKLSLLQNNILVINRAAAVNRLIDQLGTERRYAYEFALRKDQYDKFSGQLKHTDEAIDDLERSDPGLKNIKSYTMLDALGGVRKNIQLKGESPDAAMGYYTTTIFRISYLDATPELMMGNAARVNRDIQGLKALSEMNIYLAIINSNIYNVLYTHSKYAVGTLYGLVGLYQVYNTFKKEFMLKASPEAVAAFSQAEKNTALTKVTSYLDASFKRMNIDSTYNDAQWWQVSGMAGNQLKQLQATLASRVNNTLIGLENSEKAKVGRLLYLLIFSLLLISFIIVYTIRAISGNLNELASAAEKISAGETNLTLGVYPDDAVGKLTGAIAKIDENNKMLAGAANAIGGGDFDVGVKPRGVSDILGNSILQMKDKLQQLTGQRLAYTAELEKLLESVKQSETRFRLIADETPLVIWQIDSKGNVIYINRQWLVYTGMSFEQSTGRSWMTMLHADDAQKRKFARVFLKRMPYRSTARFMNAEGEYRWMYILGNPVFSNDEFVGFVGSLTDINDQILAEQALVELMQKKDEFLSIASHELKTPLTSIKAYTQLLHKSIDPADKSYPFITKTLNHIARLERLIGDLLDVSRINSGQMIYGPEEFEFAGLMRQSVEDFRDVAGKHRIIVQNIAACKLYADRARLEQVFNNLLRNAEKYSPNADTIIVNSYVEAGWLYVSVQDFGVGIAKKDQPQLFGRFYRSEKTYNKFQGLGLGLFISSEIIKRHNGEIYVESETGKGSTFYFKLPVVST